MVKWISLKAIYWVNKLKSLENILVTLNLPCSLNERKWKNELIRETKSSAWIEASRKKRQTVFLSKEAQYNFEFVALQMKLVNMKASSTDS